MTNAAIQVVLRRSFSRVSWHDADLDAALFDEFRRDPDRLLSGGTMLKDGNRSTVVRIDRGDRVYTLKRYNRMGAIHSAVHLFMRSRARWNWINGRRMQAAGLCAPRPYACLERRFGPLRCASYFLCEFVEGDMLLELVRDGRLESDGLRQVADQFSRIWKTLGDLRISHGDMKATNFIVDRQRRLWMLDLDGMRRQWGGWWWKRQRAKDRARFMKNWRGLGESEDMFRACVDTA